MAEDDALKARIAWLEAENAELKATLLAREAAGGELLGVWTPQGLPEPGIDLISLGLPPGSEAIIHRTVRSVLIARFEARALVAWAPGSYGPRWREVRAVPDLDPAGQVVRVTVVARDVTERETMRQRLMEREAVQRAILDNYPDGAIVVFDRSLRFVFVGGMGLERVGLDADDMLGRPIDEAFPAETADLIRPAYEAALRGEALASEVPFRDRVYAVSHHPVRASDGRVIYGMAITRDVTEQRASEARRSEAEARNAALIQSFPGAVFLFDANGNYLAVGGRAVRETGYDPEALVGRNVVDATPNGSSLLQSLRDCLRYGARTEDATYSDRTFEIRWLPLGHQGAPAVLAVVLDVTASRAETRRREREAAAQEALLREVHHRVKNNLQAVQSLMNMAARREGSAVARQCLLDVRTRVHAMSQVHEQLYRSEDLTRVRLDQFVEGLVRQLVRTLPPLGRAEVTVDVAPIEVGADDALEVGLICTELITNASRHALKERSGKVDITVRSGDSGLHLEVADDGPGLPPDAAEPRGSLGLWLVATLAERRGGKLTALPAASGAHWQVDLPHARVALFEDDAG
jgi:PAS domain S-box-containing protein